LSPELGFAALEVSIFRFLLFMGRRMSDVFAGRTIGERPAGKEAGRGERGRGDATVFAAGILGVFCGSGEGDREIPRSLLFEVWLCEALRKWR
jgi:hypothetical protein